VKAPLLFTIILSCSLFARTASSIDVIAIDFGRNETAGAGVVSETGTSALEPGFRGFTLGQNFGTGIATLSYPGISPLFSTGTVTIDLQGDAAAGQMGGRDRGSPLDNGAFTYGDLLRDGVARTKQSSGGDFTFRISGLNPNFAYSIRIWSGDSTADAGTTFNWFDTTSGSTAIGSVFNGPNNPLTATSNEDYSIFANVTSNAAGQLQFGVISTNGSATAGWTNGFVLSAVPEPSAAVLMTLAGLIFRGRCRRCKSS
jgi:hypothetical protein